ncbi:MAG: nucleotidyltransferase domain-containing protein [Deltaproteobacteria bacterium]|nr:nucleotidyltransferase domain-containing protein [Deltaproteobacteria bacterium]
MLDLNKNELVIIREILKRYIHDSHVLAFGSRCTGQARKYSDLDLAIYNNISINDLAWANMRADFDESDLSFRVDIINWNDLDEEFRQTIKSTGILIL